MLISDNVLFLHVPKTGGRSISEYLVNNLRGPITESLGYKWALDEPRELPFDDITPRASVFSGRRHEDVGQAVDVLARIGRTLSDFELIIAVIRNPYDLEVSHYEHLRKARVIQRRGINSVPVKAAATGDFGYFVDHAPFFGCLPAQMERYYTHLGSVPDNMRLVRFERLAESVQALVAPFSFARWAFPHVNVSPARRPYPDYLTPEIEHSIFEKYRYLFEYYERSPTASERD